jgi:hypothetical protein
MKSFKAIFPTTAQSLLSFFLILGIAQHTSAQDAAQKSQITAVAKVMTDTMTRQLSLTEKQAGSVQGLNETAVTQLLQLAQKKAVDSTMKGGVLAKQVIGIMKQRDAALQKLLTPDQLKIYEQLKLERWTDLQTEMMRTQLDLTDAQVPQVYRINYKYIPILMADVQKIQGNDRKLKKARAAKSAQADSAEKDKELKAIFSVAQYEVYIKNKQEMQAAIKEAMQEKK